MALLPQQKYQICFNRREYRNRARLPATGYVRVKSANATVLIDRFSVNSTQWSRYCSSTFMTSSSDNNLQFGIYVPDPDRIPIDLINRPQLPPIRIPLGSYVAYLVDDIEVIEK